MDNKAALLLSSNFVQHSAVVDILPFKITKTINFSRSFA